MIDTLTERELEILPLLAGGLTNQQIAERLFLSPSTVKWYIRQMNAKLDTSNRDEIVEKASDLGLLNDKPKQPARVKHNLPAQTTPFIGREEELEEIAEILARDDVRLLTILAPGGMGKTRLAFEAVEQQLGRFKDGVYFVSMQGMRDIDQIIPQIANTAGYDTSGKDRAQVLRFFANKTMLLCIDSFEHLVEGADQLTAILVHAPDVKMLVTSRVKLNITIETVLMLRGMRCNHCDGVIMNELCDAVALFVRVAQRVNSNWKITPENRETVLNLCKLMQGMPLGIILSAGWLDMLTVDQLYDEVHRNIDVLETQMQDVPERQRSIRAVFDSAWQRLALMEQQAFMRLSVFRGGCTPRAAETVTGTRLWTMHNLADKGLLLRTGNDRFELHELLRQYAERELDQVGLYNETRHAHMYYYANAIKEREVQLEDHRMLSAIEDIETDIQNVLLALDWSISQHNAECALKIFVVLVNLRIFQGRILELVPWIEKALEIFKIDSGPQERELIACLLRVMPISINDGAKIQGERSEVLMQIAVENNDNILLAHALMHKATSNDTHASIDYLMEALSIAHSEGNRFLEARIAASLAKLYVGVLDDFEAGRQWVVREFELAQQIGNPWVIASSANNMGVYYELLGQHQKAEMYYRECIHVSVECNFRSLAEFGYGNLSVAACYRRDFELAEACLRYLRKQAEFANTPNELAGNMCSFAQIMLLQGRIDEAEDYLNSALPLIPQVEYIGTTVICRRIQADVLCGRGKYEEAAAILYEILPTIVKILPLHQQLYGLISTALLLATYHNEPERAVEVAALLDHHTMIMIWKVHPFREQVFKLTQSMLNDDAFEAAYAQGKSTSAKALIREIIDQFCVVSE